MGDDEEVVEYLIEVQGRGLVGCVNGSFFYMDVSKVVKLDQIIQVCQRDQGRGLEIMLGNFQIFVKCFNCIFENLLGVKNVFILNIGKYIRGVSNSEIEKLFRISFIVVFYLIVCRFYFFFIVNYFFSIIGLELSIYK